MSMNFKNMLSLILPTFLFIGLARGSGVKIDGEYHPDFSLNSSAQNYIFDGPNVPSDFLLGQRILFGYDLVAFEDWHSSQRENLFPVRGYSEPTVSRVDDRSGMLYQKKKDLEIFEVRFAFVVDKPLAHFSREKVFNNTFIASLDRSFVHSPLSLDRVELTYDPQIDEENWCGSGRGSFCINSRFDMGAMTARAVNLARRLLNRTLPDYIEFQTEVTFLEGDNNSSPLYNSGWVALRQNTFYINSYFQYGVSELYFFEMADNKTLIVASSAIGVELDILEVDLPLGIDNRSVLLGVGDLAEVLSLARGANGIDQGLVPYFEDLSLHMKKKLEEN